MYAKVRPKPLATSQRKSARMPRSIRAMAVLLLHALRQQVEGDQHAGSGDDPEQRDRQEHLTAQPHQLVVAVARHGGAYPDEHEQQNEYLQAEPDDARD